MREKYASAIFVSYHKVVKGRIEPIADNEGVERMEDRHQWSKGGASLGHLVGVLPCLLVRGMLT